MSQKRSHVPTALKDKKSSGGTLRYSEEEQVLLESVFKIWRPDVSISVVQPQPSTSSSSPLPKKSRRSLNLREDSDSEGESGGEEDEPYNVMQEREITRRMRKEAVLYAEGRESDVDGVKEQSVEVEQGIAQPTLGPEHNDLDVFAWSEDFSTFSGQEETYLRSPGPTVDAQEPVDIFMTVWDERIMQVIVDETNRYAWQIISQLSETADGCAKVLDGWNETTVAEMYRYFAMLILMSMCYRSRVCDYWTTDILEMQQFRKMMSRNRFFLITKFLHFKDNYLCDSILSSYDRKISQIRPILDHCNAKFASLYVPNKHLSLDESLLLWKGRLSWVQCIRSKAARFGIRSYELCEAVTGYQVRCLLYAGKESTMIEESMHGFENCTAKVVLELMDGFLDVGHTLVLDNWYNQLPLARFLKRRRTDVIGTINPRRVHIPNDIKIAKERQMARGDQIARHCGDISLVAWKDVKLVTTMSTYHSNLQLPVRKAGETARKPESIVEYNKYMGGVDSKDQKLSSFLMERKRGNKWYMKVFKRLLNTSLLNTFIIYTKHPVLRALTHREFRNKVALDLLEKFPIEGHLAPPVPQVHINLRRLQMGNHFVEHTPFLAEKNRYNPKRCVRCTAAGRRKMVTIMCSFCEVALCAGTCWVEYHTLKKLR